MAAADLSSLRYDRVCRTADSEAFLLSEGEQPLGRIDLHYGASVVHALVVLERELDEETMRALVERVDDDLVWTSDRPRDDFLITIYLGQEVASFSDVEDGEDDLADGEDED